MYKKKKEKKEKKIEQKPKINQLEITQQCFETDMDTSHV